MGDSTRLGTFAFGVLASLTFSAAAQAPVEFGDDTSRWARDGECDDPRFEGDGMATILLDEDAFRDATDCRELYEQGRIALGAEAALLAEVDPALDPAEHVGVLQNGDATLETGEYYDTFEFAGQPGQRVVIDLFSDAFDTYLIMVPPQGEQQWNDDADSTSHSRIESEITESGVHRVVVTSYEPGEFGRYRLTIDQNAGAATQAPAADPEAAEIAVGERAAGELVPSDSTLSSGEYADTFAFEGAAGQSITVELQSEEFDTYVALITPAGDQIDNDDYRGDTSRSVVALTLPETGRYRVLATSYSAGETGSYEIDVTESAGLPVSPSIPAAGRVYGVFAGISDYPGDWSDLGFTADDAVRLRDALTSGGGMREEDQITLTDGEATRAAVFAAIRDVGSRAGADDTFVFFFSGHGDRVDRAGGPTGTDPDALDETIELYDGPVLDDELSELLSEIGAGTTLVFLDSCFSGGFAKDVISVPGRMGLFSSEEDVTSSVAAKFRAGGYLSLFLADAISEKLADTDGDRAVSAIELSQYVYERYRSDVKGGNDDFVRAGAAQTNYQHLVVDRGSIGPYDILFR